MMATTYRAAIKLVGERWLLLWDAQDERPPGFGGRELTHSLGQMT